MGLGDGRNDEGLEDDRETGPWCSASQGRLILRGFILWVMESHRRVLTKRKVSLKAGWL